jgi:type IV pilus assembly protein PilY1
VSEAPLESCRRSYHILFTDGQWNDNASQWGTGANSDNLGIAALPATPAGAAGPAYSQQAPYPGQTGNPGANSLADLAFRYWATDLQSSAAMQNNIDTLPGIKKSGTEVYSSGGASTTVSEFWNPKNNPAYWQHLQTYAVGFGEAAEMSAAQAGVADSVAPTFSGTTTGGNSFAELVIGSRQWPTVENFDLRQFDLWHAAVNSRGNVYPATNLQQLVDAFKSILSEILAGNAPTGGAASSLSFSPGFLAVSAGYEGTPTWRGVLKGFGQTSGSINSTAEFDSQVAITAQPESSRVVLTASNATTGIPFRWSVSGTTGNGTTSLSNFQQLMLNRTSTGAVDNFGALRVRYLRGSQQNDVPLTGEPTFRDRKGAVLGSIVNSEPRTVGVPRSGFPDASYRQFRDNNVNREQLVYVGANDGMLHAFNADGTSPDKGKARLSYVPRGVFARLSDYTDLSYTHKYFVDGPIFAGDIKEGSDWKSILIGGLGGGGKGIFGLNITDPTKFTETEAASVVMFDHTAPSEVLSGSDLAALNTEWPSTGGTLTSEISTHLGHIFGDPVRDPFIGRNLQIALMENDRWALILGNGVNSVAERPALYVIYLDTTGGFTKIVPSNAAANAANNGLSTPLPIDDDGDGKVDTVYAGDLRGNLWKFDLSSNNPAAWTIRNGTSTGLGQPPLVTTAANRPITTAPIITSHPQGGSFLVFGTGRYISTSDKTSAATESVYGIWEKPGATTGTIPLTELDTRNLTAASVNDFNSTGNRVRTLTTTDVDYATKRGWKMDLLVTSERVVFNPIMRGRVAFISTFVPLDGPVCERGTNSGALLAFDAINGKPAIRGPVIDVNNDGQFNSADYAEGASSNTVGALALSFGKLAGIIARGSSGSNSDRLLGAQRNRAVPPNLGPGRQAWRELAP